MDEESCETEQSQIELDQDSGHGELNTPWIEEMDLRRKAKRRTPRDGEILENVDGEGQKKN